MGGDAADDAFHRAFAGVDGEALRLGDGRVGAAEFADVDVAVVVDVVDCHADLVGVAGEHEPRAAALVEYSDAVTVGVGVGFVGVLADVVEPHAETAGFVAGGAGSVDEGLEELQ